MKKPILTMILLIAAVCCFSQKGKHTVIYHYKKLKKSEGYYLKKQKHGTWMYWNMEGDLEKIETYSKGELNGTYLFFKTVLFFNNRLDIIKYWEDNYTYFLKKQNEQTSFDTLIIGNYRNNLKDGLWSFINENYTPERWSYTYVNDKKNGPAMKYTYRSLDILDHYKDDMKNGPCTTYWNHSNINKIENFEYGLKNGLSLTYHYDGMLTRKCSYKNDTLNGEYYDSSYYYHEVTWANYLMGKLDGSYKHRGQYGWFQIGNYSMGEKIGLWTDLNDNDKEMHTYVGDTLYGPYSIYYESISNEYLNDLLEGYNKISPGLYPSPDMNHVRIIGRYFNNNLRSVNIYESDTVPVASFTGSQWGQLNGPYQVYQKGKLIFEGYFTADEPDSTWTYYDSTGKVSQIVKYELLDTAMNDYGVVYRLVKYPDGKIYSEYDYYKRIKNYYWQNGKLRARFFINYIEGLTFQESLYTKSGKLWKTSEYLLDGSLNEQRIYDKTQEDDISILSDDDFGIGTPILVEPLVEEVFTYVEQRAEYPGGMYAMREFLNLNFRRNPGAGIIIIQFMVDQYGMVGDVEIKSDDVGNGNAIELAKTVMKMPKFNPSKQNGRSVITKVILKCTLSYAQNADFEVEYFLEPGD